MAATPLSTEPRGRLSKIVTEITLKIKIIAYSAIKTIANFTEPYSILNPETSSDSPSAKSKGVRFNSAKTVNPHRVKARLLNAKIGVKIVGMLAVVS